MIDKNSVLKYLKSKDLAVLSTSSLVGKPQSAVMAITVADDFTIFMNTDPNSRKCIHILGNNQASLVVGGLSGDPSIQLDGSIKILDNHEADMARKYMLSVNPSLADYFTETSKFIQFKPIWARWSDFACNPPTIQEFSF